MDYDERECDMFIGVGSSESGGNPMPLVAEEEGKRANEIIMRPETHTLVPVQLRLTDFWRGLITNGCVRNTKKFRTLRGHPYMTSALRGGGGLAQKKM